MGVASYTASDSFSQRQAMATATSKSTSSPLRMNTYTLATLPPNPKSHESNQTGTGTATWLARQWLGELPRNIQKYGLLPRGYTLAKSMLLDGSMMWRGEGGGEAPALMMVSPMVACRVERIPCRRGRTHQTNRYSDRGTRAVNRPFSECAAIGCPLPVMQHLLFVKTRHPHEPRRHRHQTPASPT